MSPAPGCWRAAVTKRWPVPHSTCPPGSPSLPVAGASSPSSCSWPWVGRRAGACSSPAFRLSRAGSRFPDEGPAIIVGSPWSCFNPLAIGLTLSKKAGRCGSWAQKEVFDVPLGRRADPEGHGRHPGRPGDGVRRPLRAAADALLAGQQVALMPEDDPRGAGVLRPGAQGAELEPRVRPGCRR